MLAAEGRQLTTGETGRNGRSDEHNEKIKILRNSSQLRETIVHKLLIGRCQYSPFSFEIIGCLGVRWIVFSDCLTTIAVLIENHSKPSIVRLHEYPDICSVFGIFNSRTSSVFVQFKTMAAMPA